MTKKIPLIIAYALIAVLTLLFVLLLTGVIKPESQQKEESAAYQVYIGTGDSGMTREEARNEIIRICNENLGGFTLADSLGGSSNQYSGVTSLEECFVLSLFYTDRETVDAFADKLMDALGQKTCEILEYAHTAGTRVAQ